MVICNFFFQFLQLFCHRSASEMPTRTKSQILQSIRWRWGTIQADAERWPGVTLLGDTGIPSNETQRSLIRDVNMRQVLQSLLSNSWHNNLQLRLTFASNEIFSASCALFSDVMTVYYTKVWVNNNKRQKAKRSLMIEQAVNKPTADPYYLNQWLPTQRAGTAGNSKISRMRKRMKT